MTETYSDVDGEITFLYIKYYISSYAFVNYRRRFNSSIFWTTTLIYSL